VWRVTAAGGFCKLCHDVGWRAGRTVSHRAGNCTGRHRQLSAAAAIDVSYSCQCHIEFTCSFFHSFSLLSCLIILTSSFVIFIHSSHSVSSHSHLHTSLPSTLLPVRHSPMLPPLGAVTNTHVLIWQTLPTVKFNSSFSSSCWRIGGEEVYLHWCETLILDFFFFLTLSVPN
jgi:hypothetical protein